MRWLGALLLGALVGQTPGRAFGGGEPAQPEIRLNPAPVLPTLTISAESKGKGTLSVGLSWLFPVGGDKSNSFIEVKPHFQATTDNGVALLASQADSEREARLSFGGGLTFSYLWLGPVPTHADQRQAKITAYVTCARRCASDALRSKDEEAFCELRRKRMEARRSASGSASNPAPAPPSSPAAPAAQADLSRDLPAPTEYSYDDWCTRGKSVWDDTIEKPFATNKHASVPLARFSLGIVAEAATSKFLAANPLDATVLSRQQSTDTSVKGAGEVVYVPRGSGKTFELQALLARRFAPADSVAKWCAPGGSVSRGDAPLPADPAEVCRELPLGAPSRTVDLRLGLFTGLIDREPSPRWRATIGPVYRLQRKAGASEHMVGAQVPIYFAVFNLPGAYRGEYKGLARLTPSFITVKQPGGWDSRVFLTLELLAARTMFPDPLDPALLPALP